MSQRVPAAVLFLLLCTATVGLSKVHDVVWEIPTNGLQLPSISTARCGDTIRFRCPVHITQGIFKLEQGNYNGTCPQDFNAASAGETLLAPKKACDFNLTLTDGPDFYLTSPVPGACHKNLKVYVHTVCIKNDNTFASGLMTNVPALPTVSARRRRHTEHSEPGLPAAGYVGVVADTGAPGTLGVLGGSLEQHTLGAAVPRLQAASGTLRMAGASPDVLETGKQSGAAHAQPVLGKVAGLALGAAALLLVL